MDSPKRGRGRPPKPGGPMTGTERNIRWAQNKADQRSPIANLPSYLGRYPLDVGTGGERREWVATCIVRIIAAIDDFTDEYELPEPIVRLLGGTEYVSQVLQWDRDQASRKKAKMAAPDLP